jgi:hypothetical protein
MTNALVPYSDIEKMASAISASKLFGVKSPNEAIALMLIAQAEGMHPATAARDFHVIQGRPALKADAMLARFQQAGGKVEWKVYTDAEVTGIFSHPQGGSLTVSWTLKQAREIGLAGKDNWNKYPRAMLRARCISEGIRSVYPGCVVGVYTPEEVEDFSNNTSRPAPQPVPPQPIETIVDISSSPQDGVPDQIFPLFVPGSNEAYKTYHTLEDWNAGYLAMQVRIKSSTKLDDEMKELKLLDLENCNKEVLGEM